MWFVLNCVPKSTEHVVTVLFVPTSPASSLRSPSPILCHCFSRLGSRQDQSLHQQSCLLGCMHPLPSMSHPLPSLRPRQNGRGLTNARPLCLSASACSSPVSHLADVPAGPRTQASGWKWTSEYTAQGSRSEGVCQPSTHEALDQAPASVNRALQHTPVMSTLKRRE